MILLDTNILIYATDARSPFHAASRRILDASITRTLPGILVPQVLVEYVAATTGPSMQSPLAPEAALAQVAVFRSQIQTLSAPSSALDHLTTIIAAGGRAGRRTFDAYLAAQALALGVATICTYNTADFSGIQGLTVVTPDDVT